MLASAPFASEVRVRGAAMYHELRKRGTSPHFSHSMRPALLFRRGRYSVGRRKAYRGIRLSRPTLEMPAERQPKGPVEEADRVRRPVGFLNRRRPHRV